MFAVADRGVARPPPPLNYEDDSSTLFSGSEALAEDTVKYHMQCMLQDLPVRVHDNVIKLFLGKVGMAIDADNDMVSYGHWSDSEGHKICVVMYGNIENEAEVRELYGVLETSYSGMETTSSSAQLLLALYSKGFVDAYGDATSQPETCLDSMEGAFSFVLFDTLCQWLLAARDRGGRAPLVWGLGKNTGAMLFASDERALKEECCRGLGAVSQFPAGCYYESSDQIDHGLVISYVKRGRQVHGMPRIDSSGQLCGSIFRAASGGDLASLAYTAQGQSNITAQ